MPVLKMAVLAVMLQPGQETVMVGLVAVLVVMGIVVLGPEAAVATLEEVAQVVVILAVVAVPTITGKIKAILPE